MKHRKAMADTVSVAPDGTLLSLGGVPLAIPTSPTESNSNFNQSGVVLADPGHSRSGAGGTASRISHSEPDEVLFPQPFLQVLIFLCTIKLFFAIHYARVIIILLCFEFTSNRSCPYPARSYTMMI